MCGVAGCLVRPGSRSEAWLLAMAESMTGRLARRGPDGSGTWVDASAGVALGHRRLSIIDLTSGGAQPRHSRSGRWSITYNGELYNHRALRRDLERSGTSFESASDTEVLLTAIEEWGLRRALERADGMFAFAVWDANRRELTLVRDRLGEKPLYYARAGTDLIFASELESLRTHPSLDRGVDPAALRSFLRLGRVPSPMSIHPGVYKLPPGCLVRLRSDATSLPEPERYWSFVDIATAVRTGPEQRGEIVDGLEEVLRRSVRSRMVADVPVGAFLSGGIDSSLVVALAREISQVPVQTFTVGFPGRPDDEAADARAIADRLGTVHTELPVGESDMLRVVPKLASIWDEPFADGSQIPTFLVSELASRHVKVALTGDGGDELFGGYSRYRVAEARWARVSRRSPVVRRASAVPLGLIARLVGHGRTPDTRLLPTGIRGKHVGRAARTYRLDLLSDDLPMLYEQLNSAWIDEPVVAHHDGSKRRQPEPEGLAALGAAERLWAIDTMTYLPDDILTKVDRAGMTVGLEARLPLLAPDVVAFAWSLPVEARTRRDVTKGPLRDVLIRHIPSELIDRPKRGFGAPIDDWLRGPLRGWANDLLSPALLRQQGHLRPEPISDVWDRHANGQGDWGVLLWPVLMFQAWLAELGAPRDQLV